MWSGCGGFYAQAEAPNSCQEPYPLAGVTGIQCHNAMGRSMHKESPCRMHVARAKRCSSFTMVEAVVVVGAGLAVGAVSAVVVISCGMLEESQAVQESYGSSEDDVGRFNPNSRLN